MTDIERAVLVFEKAHPQRWSPVKARIVRSVLGLSGTTYYATLHRLRERAEPEALEYAPEIMRAPAVDDEVVALQRRQRRDAQAAWAEGRP